MATSTVQDPVAFTININDSTFSSQREQLTSSVLTKSPLDQIEIVRDIISFIGHGQYRFIASINRLFYDAYRQLYPDTYQTTYLNLSTLDMAQICYTEAITHRSILCRCAARYGNVQVLHFLRSSRDCTWDASTCYNAAKYGHLPILMYARQNHCPWGKHTIYYAAIHGHVHIVLWSQMNGCPWEDDHIVRAAVYMNQKNNLIDYLHHQMHLE
jgi:hypothetical protein